MKKTKKSTRHLFIFNALLLVAAFVMIEFAVKKYEKQPLELPQPVLQGRMMEEMTVYEAPQDMPDFTFKTAFDKEMRLDDFKGQWVILNFWATWCPPCLIEMPSLQALQDKMGGQGLQVVAVSLDRNMNGEKLRSFINKHEFGPIAAYYDPSNQVIRGLSLAGLPTTFILAPNGKVFAKFEGDADWISDDSLAFVESLFGRD